VVNANARNLARVTGPVAMGLITRAAGIPVAYAVATALYLIAALLLFRLVPRPPAQGRPPVTWASIREGIAFVRSRPPILGAMALDMFAVIFAGATAMLPVFADKVLHVGEVGYGLLASAMQAGTLVMAALLLVRQPLERPGKSLLGAIAVFGLATVVFGLSRSFPLSLLSFFVAGMADQVNMTSRSIILQLSTPDELRGRVSSVSMIFIGASNELGAAESGFLAALTSATFSVVFGGVACLGVGAAIGVGVPSLRAFRTDSPHG
jgi:MFS family permease